MSIARDIAAKYTLSIEAELQHDGINSVFLTDSQKALVRNTIIEAIQDYVEIKKEKSRRSVAALEDRPCVRDIGEAVRHTRTEDRQGAEVAPHQPQHERPRSCQAGL